MSYYPRGHRHRDGDQVDDFDDYDTHPYDGGCNLLFSYGHPLPPNPEICHPPTPLLSHNDDHPHTIPIFSHTDTDRDQHKEKHGLSSLADHLHFIHPRDGGEKSDDDDDEDEDKKKHRKHHSHRKHYDD